MLGRNSGTVTGHSCFHCEDDYGKFVPLNRLVKYYSRLSSSTSQEPGKPHQRDLKEIPIVIDDPFIGGAPPSVNSDYRKNLFLVSY